ncbi:MAG: FAD-binding protein [Betaproteobacteria bacterium]|nr:FAD-binding protein [Betaproteobacteria bacterium]MBI2509574.1 FAD-binding protein [Betaproteobacteria bacterium]
MKADWTTLDADLLVVGGGVAGTMAAIPALEAGLKVVICEKGKVLDHCGSIGCGVDHYLTVMDTGPEWDTPDFLIKHVPELTDHIVDMAVAGRVIREMPRIFRKIESFGVDFRDRKTGDYYRLRSFGLPGTYHINFDGTDFKKHIGERVRKGKATVLMRTMVVQLLVEDNRAYGAVAFNFRTGEWHVIRAKAVVLAAGDVNRISRNASGLAFDSWHFPYNTGDAQAMGYRVGAALANMESVETTLTPKGFSCQGLNALVSLGAYFVNRRGERFMFKYDKKGENARRAVIADAAINEYLLGNGPVYLDCRHLPQEILDRMEYTLQVDRYTLPAYYKQKGVNFRKELVEISVSELSIRRSGVYFRGSGLAVDENGETSVEGLFAAGDCATVSGGIAGAAVLGHIAGEGVVLRVRSTNGALPSITPEMVEAVRAQSDLHLNRGNGMTWKQFENETRQTVTDYVGVRRTEAGLRLALQTLHSLAGREPTLVADDLHGLMRVHEAKNIRMNAEIMATASLSRKETRTGSSHWRLDYPETDDRNWRKFVLVDRGGDGPRIRTLSTERPLSDAFDRSAA